MVSECDYHGMNNIIPAHKAEPLDTKFIYIISIVRDAERPHPTSRILHAPTTVHYCTVIASIVTDADAAESLHPAGCTWVLLTVCCIINQ